MGARSSRVFIVLDPKIAEVLAIKEALTWCVKDSYTKVQVESDSEMVVKAIQSSEQDNSTFGQIIRDCQHILSLSNGLSIHHVRRSTNHVAHQVAHVLARASDSMSDSNEWGTDPANFLISVLLCDLYD